MACTGQTLNSLFQPMTQLSMQRNVVGRVEELRWGGAPMRGARLHANTQRQRSSGSPSQHNCRMGSANDNTAWQTNMKCTQGGVAEALAAALHVCHGWCQNVALGRPLDGSARSGNRNSGAPSPEGSQSHLRWSQSQSAAQLEANCSPCTKLPQLHYNSSCATAAS